MKTHTLYILCFDKPYFHARHYIGSTADFDARVAEHRTGRTTPLLKAILEAGIGFTAHIIGEGGRSEERQLKRQRNSARHCPRCKQEKKK